MYKMANNGLENGNLITEEEAELYDRQIRLWGAGVQRSLRSTRVLVIGMNGVAAEMSKNLILSGIKSLTMMDSSVVCSDDLSSQYLLFPKSVGQNKAEASLEAAQILNPNVKVNTDTSSLLDKPISFYSNFDIVCVTRQTSNIISLVNFACKTYGVKFLCGDSFGMFGYLFEDLYNVNSSVVSYQDAMNHKWVPKTSVKRRKNEDPSFLLFKILMQFRNTAGRNPSRIHEEGDFKMLMTIRDLVLKEFNVDADILPSEYFENVFGEFGPTCSIIGGMMAQEVVKSMSQDASLTNSIYFFNHLRNQVTGMVLVEDPKLDPIMAVEEVIEL